MLQTVAQLAAAVDKHAVGVVDASSTIGNSKDSSSLPSEGSAASVVGHGDSSNCATGEAAVRLQRIGSAFAAALPAAGDAAQQLKEDPGRLPGAHQ